MTIETLQEKIHKLAVRDARDAAIRFRKDLSDAFERTGFPCHDLVYLQRGGHTGYGDGTRYLRLISLVVNHKVGNVEQLVPELVAVHEERITKEVLDATKAIQELEDRVEAGEYREP